MPNIKGPGLEHLKALPLLEDLRLSETGVTDETIKHITVLKQLKSVNLPRSAKLASLGALKGMTNLTTIVVPMDWDADAVAAVKKAFPKADVLSGD